MATVEDWQHFQCNDNCLFQLKIPVTYPTTAPEIALPELDGKTAKMYRGGKICLTDHFKPLWARNVPKFGIAHAMALGVSIIYKKLNISIKTVHIFINSYLVTAGTMVGSRNSRSYPKRCHRV